jgi:CheY-like chemotaxis protein
MKTTKTGIVPLAMILARMAKIPLRDAANRLRPPMDLNTITQAQPTGGNKPDQLYPVSEEPETKPAILIVEDEGIIAFEMMEFLSRQGYRVLDPVTTGEEAVVRCGKLPRPDLVLMDLILAGKMDGIEAIRRIRAHFPIPVIVLTASEENRAGTNTPIRDLAPDGYLVKPLAHEDLLAAISRALPSNARGNVLKST